MAVRHDDLTGDDRAEIALRCWAAQGKRDGTVQELAEEYNISRQSVNNIERKGREGLREMLEPGRHGPEPQRERIEVTREHLRRSCVVLSEVGVSQRNISFCQEEMLGRGMSPAWVNAELARLEELAAAVNQEWQPQMKETMSGDEIYANGKPNLLVVGNDTLYIYELSRQPECDGERWGCILLDLPDVSQFSSDGGTGLGAGVKEAGLKVHQLDWDHLLRPLWGQVSRLEEQAYTALEAVEERAVKFEQAHTPGRLKQHLKAWEKLEVKAEEKVTRYDAFFQIARQVDAWFALIDLENGQLRNPEEGSQSLCKLGKQLETWEGGIYQKLSRNLNSFAKGLFSYQPVLAQALAPLVERWGSQAIQSLSRLWQIEADEKRQPSALLQQRTQQQLWGTCLDEALSFLGEEQFWTAWEAVRETLSRSWRGSMLAECVNSLLRPILDGRKHTDQGCLELFRFLHNVRPFQPGKRAGKSPAQLVNLDVPDDPLTLLGLT
ncbi:MAG: hypothetical protein GY927_25170 [bacterium]|nr:hypothetical protein [bacterium]